jgi:hypothetical protein
VKEFQDTAIDIICQESPDTAHRIITRLKERRALRPSAELPTRTAGDPMALWRDPLDDLIDELERAVPAAQATDNDLFDLVLMQRWVATILYGSEEDCLRMESEPWYAEWTRQWDRFTARVAKTGFERTPVDP